jgi:choline transporter-like protein 2/4/5
MSPYHTIPHIAALTTQYHALPRTKINNFLSTLVEDLERNDGSEEKPYYMSKKLKKILGKKNKRNSDSE